VPFISAFAARLPLVLGRVVIVEYFFTLDGAGYLLLEASKQRDFPIVVGLSVLFTAVHHRDEPAGRRRARRHRSA
jgi:ABC-type dipeptide/oligopeptide/nickel transport system permease component